MAWWIYLGKVTTPVSGGVSATINEKGAKPTIVKRDPNVSTVLVPRLKFEAPMSVVSHLIRLKKVAGLKPHQIPKLEEEPQKKEVTAAQPAPVVEQKKEEPKTTSSDGKTPVVASDEKKDVEAGEEKTKVKLEKEKEKGGTKGSKKRRG